MKSEKRPLSTIMSIAYRMELDPETEKVLHMKLFKNVSNMKQLRHKLLDGQLNCCLIKASLICDPLQVAVAANKAVTAASLTTKSLYTQILFNLSVSKNITQSLKTFGIDETDHHVLVVTVHKKSEEEEDDDEVMKHIEGEEVDISHLSALLDVDSIKKTYKINDIEYKSTPLVSSVVSRIASKDVMSL